MATLTTSTFAKYSLNLIEELSGSILTDYQKMYIQNKICEIAESKLALTADPKDYASYIQQEAYLAGQLAALSWMLATSEEALKLRFEEAKNDILNH